METTKRQKSQPTNEAGSLYQELVIVNDLRSVLLLALVWRNDSTKTEWRLMLKSGEKHGTFDRFEASWL
jgi:hypothetical protein